MVKYYYTQGKMVPKKKIKKIKKKMNKKKIAKTCIFDDEIENFYIKKDNHCIVSYDHVWHEAKIIHVGVKTVDVRWLYGASKGSITYGIDKKFISRIKNCKEVDGIYINLKKVNCALKEKVKELTLEKELREELQQQSARDAEDQYFNLLFGERDDFDDL